ncbi:MAG: hypothetical protein NTW96_06815 [Planctomycetia bacterium]|nr:hypothetical protein [Planctomycetia bacterium]
MSKTRLVCAVVTVTALCGILMATSRQAAAQSSPWRAASGAETSNKSKGMAAIESAGRDGKYVFFFFWKENDQQTGAMHGVFQTAMRRWAGSADSIAIQIADANEKPVVDKFGVDRAPMPLVVAMAPNGAITKGFPIKFTEQQLEQAFVSPCTAQCLKCLQDRKLVLLCIQNPKTQFSQVAWQGVQDFKADVRFAKATEIVTVNPEDQAEATLLRDLKIDPRTSQAVTVVLAPPGQPVATFAGPVTKDQIVAKIASAQSGACAGGKCGPGGCGPKK